MASTCTSSGYVVACDGDVKWDDWWGGTDACCPSGDVCCTEEGYCCDPDFSSLHTGLSVPLFIFAAAHIALSLVTCIRTSNRKLSALCFGFSNFLFWFLVALGVAPLCGEDVTVKAQKPNGAEYLNYYSRYFSPEGDCTENLAICWGIAAGVAFLTFLGGLCRASSKASHTCSNTPADLVARTKAGTPQLTFKFECYHKTTHTDSKGRSHTSTHYTKRGSYQMPLDLVRDDLSDPVPPAFSASDHATTLDLGIAYEPSPTLAVQRDAVKAAIDAQWANYDTYYRSYWDYKMAVEKPGGAGVWDCYPNLTDKQLANVRARGYYIALFNCFATLILACRPKDTVDAAYEVSYRLKATGESTGAVLTPAALAMEAVASTLGGPQEGTLTNAVAGAIPLATAAKGGKKGSDGPTGPPPDVSAYPAAASLATGRVAGSGVVSPSAVPVAVAIAPHGMYRDPAAVPSAYPASSAYTGGATATGGSGGNAGAHVSMEMPPVRARPYDGTGGAAGNNGKGGAAGGNNSDVLL